MENRGWGLKSNENIFSKLADFFFRAIYFGRLFIARLRVFWFIFLGGKISTKCLFGAHVRIDCPRSMDIGERTILEDGVWFKMVSVDACIYIGNYGFLGRGVEIDVEEKISIGNHVLIAPGVFITDHAHNIKAGVLIDAQGCKSSPVCIADDVWLGANAVILPGVSIGRGAVVGAGAVVTKDVGENTIVVGVPAKVLRKRQ